MIDADGAGGRKPSQAATPASEELVEVLDEQGVVIDIVSRGHMRAHSLAHRSTYVAQVLIEPDQLIASGLQRPEPPDSAAVEEWLASSGWSGQYAGWLASGSLPPRASLIVHQRAHWKDIYPGYWDVAFGGVCGVGEPWLASARRELAEEAGIESAAIYPVANRHLIDDAGSVFGVVFVALSSQWPEPTDGEVIAVDEVPIAALESWLTGRDVCQDSQTLVEPALRRLMAADE